MKATLLEVTKKNTTDYSLLDTLFSGKTIGKIMDLIQDNGGVSHVIAELSSCQNGRTVLHSMLMRLDERFELNTKILNQVLYNEPEQTKLLTSDGKVSREQALYNAHSSKEKMAELAMLKNILLNASAAKTDQLANLLLLEYLAAAILENKK